MKVLISCIVGLFLFFWGASSVQAVRPQGELPKIFMMLDDENFGMHFDGVVLVVNPKKDAGLSYSCSVTGKFPQISYSGDYSVVGPYHPNDSSVRVEIMREKGRNNVSLIYIRQMIDDAEKDGINPDFYGAFADRYKKTFDAQNTSMPADLKQIEQIVRKDVNKICNDFVKYAIPRLKNPPAY